LPTPARLPRPNTFPAYFSPMRPRVPKLGRASIR